MKHARYEILEDQSFYGESQDFKACMQMRIHGKVQGRIAIVLEGWIISD